MMTTEDRQEAQGDPREAGEYVDISADEVNDDVEENDDGSAYIVMDDKTVADEEGEFFDNLAETLDPSYLKGLAVDLMELVDQDKRTQENRDKKYSEAIKRSGLVDSESPAGADFEGSSIVVHPMMLEADIDFQARVCKELLPPEGPVRDKIIGKTTQAKVDKAARKVAFMNWQLTEQIKEFRSELEQGVSQTMFGGTFYMKWWWDKRMGRPSCKAVYVDEVLLPYAASSFISANRRTHVILMTDQELEEFVNAGVYREAPAMTTSVEPDKTETQETVDKVEGRQSTGDNEDGQRKLFEVVTWREVDGDSFGNDRLCPYVITIDETSRDIIGFYRDWDPEKDQQQQIVEELDFMVEYPFIRFRGPYPLSIWDLIGNLSVAATGSLRALLDAGFVNTIPTALKLKGGFGADGGQSQELQPNGITEIEGGLTTDDVRKAVMPVPFNAPSTAMFQLLGFLVEAGKGMIRTTFDDLADNNANTPVGTTLARYEQGMVVFSSIFGRLHDAMARSLKILHRLNRYYMKESATYGEAGEILAKRSDFEGPMDVVPVSDPNIYSDTQRRMQLISVMQRATGNPLYDQRKVEEAFLKQTKLPDGEKLLIEIPQPKQMNAVNENLAATMGKTIAAFPEQDHLAHLKVHVMYAMSPALGSLPTIAPRFLPLMLEHIGQHVSLWYVSEFHDAMSKAAGIDITKLMDEDPQVAAEFDRLVADAAPSIMRKINMGLQQLPAVIQQSMQLLQQLSPPPQDPAAQAKQAETARKGAKDQTDAQLAAGKQQADAGKDQTAAQLQASKQESQSRVDAARILADSHRDEVQMKLDAQAEENRRQDAAQQRQQDAQEALAALADNSAERQSREGIAGEQMDSKEQMNQADNETAKELATMEIEHDDKVAVSTGTGINPQP